MVTKFRAPLLQWATTLLLACYMTVPASGQNPSEFPWAGREANLKKVEKVFGDPPGMNRLDKHSRVWADRKLQRVVVDGYIAIRDGQLEMLACPVGTKEHESVVALFSKAQIVHAGLLAIGAQSGTPVNWEPKYQPPTGSEIQVFALWIDEQGKKQKIDARKWVREVGGKETLKYNFVFAGSKFWKDPDSGEERYLAESGDLICVSNFATATLDIPADSSQANSGLLYAAATDAIPPAGTPVRLVLQLVGKNPKLAAEVFNESQLLEVAADPNQRDRADKSTGSEPRKIIK
jgi:hypothetical protein